MSTIDDDLEFLKKRIESLVSDSYQPTPVTNPSNEARSYITDLFTDPKPSLAASSFQPSSFYPNSTQDLTAQDFIRTALQIEDEATLIKTKLQGQKVKSHQLYGPVKFESKKPQANTLTKPKELTKQEKLLLAGLKDQEAAEDAFLAMQLLKQYQKDPAMIQRELQEQERRRKQVLDPAQDSKPSKASNLDILKLQEERHREIKEKREQRKKDQKLREIEERKEARKAPPFQQKIKQPEVNEGEEWQIENLREKKKALERETQIAAEEAKKIQQEIKEYKKAVQEQERAERENQVQQEKKRQLGIERQRIQAEVENAKVKAMDHKISKFRTVLEVLVRKSSKSQLNWSFTRLQDFNLNLKFKSLKLMKHQTFTVLHRHFRAWRYLYRKLQEKRELKIYEQQQLQLRLKLQTAELHRNRVLKRCSLKAIVKYAKLARQEREIEQEHEQRKNQIDYFFKQLKVKAAEEEERAKKEKLDKIQKEEIKRKMKEAGKEVRLISDQRLRDSDLTYTQSSPSRICQELTPESQRRQETENFQDNSEQPSVDTINFEQYRLEESKLEHFQPEVSQLSEISHQPRIHSPSTNQPNSHQTSQMSQVTQHSKQTQQSRQRAASKQPPKQVLEMEHRAKERMAKRDQLKKTYEDKQAKVLQERALAEKKAEEEKKQKLLQEREAKRKAKLDELRKQDEFAKMQEIDRQKLKFAKEYYERGLMIKYGMLAFSRMMQMVKEQRSKAKEFNWRWLRKRGFWAFKDGVLEIRAEEELRIDRLMLIAERNHSTNLKRIAVRHMKFYRLDCKQESIEMRGHYLKWVLKHALANWSLAVPTLKQERLATQAKEDLLISKYRQFKIGKKVILAMREWTKEEKKERERQRYKEQMWNKVNGWLGELDSKELGGEVENTNRYSNF